MANTIVHNDRATPDNSPETTIPPQAAIVLVAGMAAAWFAAGSTGLLGHPLQHILTWLALSTTIAAIWPREKLFSATWAILASGVIAAVFVTASAIPTVNVLGVAIVLAAIAQVSRGLTSRVALITALAAGTLALYRFLCDSIPTVWLSANAKGWVLGQIAGWLSGSSLQVGATYSGLDFLTLMTAVYAGWLVFTTPPRRSRAIWAAAAIVLGHFAYLAILAQSEKLLDALPSTVAPLESDINNVGLWTWNSGLRTLIPWNVPLVALLIHGTIAVVMFRWATWLPVIEIDPRELERQKKKEEKEEVPGSVLAADLLFCFGPPLLAVVAALLVGLGLNHADLKGKTILAYEKGFLDWRKPEHDSQIEGYYGLLPTFVESLGGKFATSSDLSEKDLATADVLILLHPNQPWQKETLDRIWAYVRRGGSLLLVADPAIREGNATSHFNEILQPTAMQVRHDTAVTRTGNWEQSYELLSHPATAGLDDRRNRLGFELGASIRTRWPASPVVVGRWGWSDPGSDAVGTGVSYYNAGELLGDLVLAAEQPIGQGRIFVLGGSSPLRNEMLANAFPFAGRLLGYLANKPSGPQAWWRQLLGLLAVLAMTALVALRPAPWQIMLTSVVMAISLVCCAAAGHQSGQVLPDGRPHASSGFNNIAYIDASHLEAYSSDLWNRQGIASLLRALMRQGYLPLLAPDLTTARLERAGLLISIAPARRFTAHDRNAVRQFVSNGGTLICLVGAEEARASAPLLAEFDFSVPPSPVLPGEKTVEPEPLGAFQQIFTEGGGKQYVQFYAGWPLDCVASNLQQWVVWSDGKNDRPLVVSHTEQGGPVIVIADTYFASNQNLESPENSLPGNVRFWRWLLSNVVPGQKPWNPPPPEKNKPTAMNDSENNDT